MCDGWYASIDDGDPAERKSRTTVFLNDMMSITPKKTICGVPQGSISGPLLF